MKIRKLKTKMKEKIMLKSLVYLLCCLMMLNCGGISDGGNPGGDDPGSENPLNENPNNSPNDPGNGDLANILAKEDEVYKGSNNNTDSEGNPVWEDTPLPEATCIENNPNSSTLKKINITMDFCLHKQDALVISDNTMYFQHFSTGQNMRLDLDQDDYMTELIADMEDFAHSEEWSITLEIISIIAYFFFGFWGLIPVSFQVLAELLTEILELFGLDEPDAPSGLPLYEPADVGLAVHCNKYELSGLTKISIDNNASDNWLSPASLPYQLNINKDPNCTTTVSNYNIQYESSQPITLEEPYFGSNGANYRTWVMKLNNLQPRALPRKTTLSFDYEYYELADQTQATDSVFSKIQEKQNKNETHVAMIKYEGKEDSSTVIDWNQFPAPECNKDKQGTSTLKTASFSLNFYALNTHSLDIMYNTMIFKHLSNGIPFTVKGHGGDGDWEFYLREPSSITMNKWIAENQSEYNGIVHVYSSAYHSSVNEYDLWKYPNFVPYNLGINQNYDCTTRIKNVSVTGDVSVSLLYTVNRNNTLIWEFIISKFPQGKTDNPTPELVKLGFDYEYYGY